MSKQGVDTGRRKMLTLATSAVGAVGAGAWAVPFVGSLAPSEKAKALGAPVTMDLSELKPGEMTIKSWRGKPVWVIRRTPDMLASLEKVRDDLADPDSEQPQQPDYIQGAARSLKPEYMVMQGVCTHLGCSPKLRKIDTAAADVGGASWQGGFFCPCHGSKFDLAGRVYSGVPAPLNIVVPPHRYASDTVLVIGEDPVAAAQSKNEAGAA